MMQWRRGHGRGARALVCQGHSRSTGIGEYRLCDGRDAWNGDLSGQRAVAQDLGGCIKVAVRISCDNHNRLLRVTPNGVGLVQGWRRERVREEKFGELALSEWDDVRLGAIVRNPPRNNTRGSGIPCWNCP